MTNKLDEAASRLIDVGLDGHAEKHVTNAWEHLCVYCRDDKDVVIGGLLGETGGGWFQLWRFWVAEDHRGLSWGSKMLAAAEEEAIRRGCKGSHLDTFSFQALEFYLKHGYRQFGVLNGYDGDHARHFLEKRLQD